MAPFVMWDWFSRKQDVVEVTLKNDMIDRAPLWTLDGPKVGVFFVMVRSVKDNGAMAIFHLSGNSRGAGNVTRTCSTRSVSGESIDIEWYDGQVPTLRHDSVKVDMEGEPEKMYRVRVISL